jgi:hypothetical protein
MLPISTNVNRDKEAKGTDVLLALGTSIPIISKSPSLFRVLRRWYWNSALRVLLTELNNLPSRIRLALEIHAWELQGYSGQFPSLLEWTRGRQCRICRHAYILYTQQISHLRPTQTVVDSHLVSAAWWAGWRSARRMDKLQNQYRNCSSCSPLGSDSMPQPVVQQSTKRGQIVQPPSQA